MAFGLYICHGDNKSSLIILLTTCVCAKRKSREQTYVGLSHVLSISQLRHCQQSEAFKADLWLRLQC